MQRNNTTIYVYHEYGAPTHYYALKTLAERNGYNIDYYEFDNFLSSLWHWFSNPTKDFRFFRNIYFIITLPFRKKCKIVLGIAPFNYKLIGLRWLLKKHEIYYHTSYTYWDNTIVAHSRFNTAYTRKIWKEFISSTVKHIFAVSEKTKSELIRNGYSTADRISVVNHSYIEKISPVTNAAKENNFIYVGRLSPVKGIEEILSIFTKLPNANLMIVGKGQLQNIVEEYSINYPNINYAGHKKSLLEIIPLYKQNSFLLLNSHRSNSWEELFGITLIEGMSCGCVPIATNHTGPLEIIKDQFSGFICEEGEIFNIIQKAISLNAKEYSNLRKNAIEKGLEYQTERMADRWIAIFK